MAVHVLGIRHHGPGSARNVRQYLEALQPDMVLVEGPPDADALLQWVGHKELQPPVAILCYQPDRLQQGVFYPFAAFSPEWQAIQYARERNIPVRFMDLPVAHVFALQNERAQRAALHAGNPDDAPPPLHMNNSAVAEETDDTGAMPVFAHDPISHLAAAAGFSDGEKWWEHMFEYRQDTGGIFDAVAEAMSALRDELPKMSRMEKLREAWMRKTIRQAEKELYTTLAVVCGAWHAPALQHMPKQKDDNELLKGLPKVKVECTWIPWTYNRLSFTSGYGAGIFSPGWYAHTWQYPHDDGTRWMARVAGLLRTKQMDTSVAHVIDAVRMAGSLAALRGYSKAGLEELNEATLSVLCNGEDVLLQLIHDALIVSDTIGDVPGEVPKPPLQHDIEKTQKSLRLPATAEMKEYTLDLRKENDLERSVFLHRLQLLDINWGQNHATGGKGTFKELWRLQWEPEYSITIIEKGSWGNTVAEAATKYVNSEAEKAQHLAIVCQLLAKALPAELPVAVEKLVQCIQNLAASNGDVVQLMEAVPGLVSVIRYGNVRNTDAAMVTGITESMITRICVGLPVACTAIDDAAAQKILELLYQTDDAVRLLQHADISVQWQQSLQVIAHHTGAAPVLKGYATRLLADAQVLQGRQLVQLFYYGMSRSNPPSMSAAWLEGFLKGNGAFLLLDPQLWQVVTTWVSELEEGPFEEVLPLLRRTFARFTPPERRKLGEKVKHSSTGAPLPAVADAAIDMERAQCAIPVVLQLLGIQQTSHE
ncbi:DUF5682 family protein [Deminuibacter soli]|uniref:Uncharacterized protein n=1 Tax=Deminuibacter soli TaxID=2291815 RepID=A0A3E1NQB3_9BACT|nr:DUF5682 family protein [Deminuibacter soli]RFM30115.1 hypothetical protein DXN05_03840 [Deminuibacter soli]